MLLPLKGRYQRLGDLMKESIDDVVPEARKDGLVVQELADEVLVYDLERHKAHCLNHTAAWIWKHCDGKATVVDMARLLRAESNAPVDEEVIWLALDQLGQNRLLKKRVRWPAEVAGLSRREILRQLGLAAVIAMPLVTSIVVPRAYAQASCKPDGAFCQAGPECCSGNCEGVQPKICVPHPSG